jgi:tRNA (cytidine/uridine-2'-O-)-methyltransferase
MNEIILVQPEIPQNTGNIARTCAVTNTSLTLVRPLGFNLSSKYLKRAGLDYWDQLNFKVVDSLEEILEFPFFFFSSKARCENIYTKIPLEKKTQLIFGSESSGLAPSYWKQWPDRFYTIPMVAQARSLNLSNAVAIVLYELLRQQNFSSL